MPFGAVVALVFGVLMIAGGAMGSKAGSKASLYAGGGSGLVLLLAGGLAAGPAPTVGLWLAAAVSLMLCVVFAVRWSKTGKAMPAAMLLALSVVALALLAREIST